MEIRHQIHQARAPSDLGVLPNQLVADPPVPTAGLPVAWMAGDIEVDESGGINLINLRQAQEDQASIEQFVTEGGNQEVAENPLVALYPGLAEVGEADNQEIQVPISWEETGMIRGDEWGRG